MWKKTVLLAVALGANLAQAQNLLTNGGFSAADQLNGWAVRSGGGSGAVFSPRDRTGDPQSGSALITGSPTALGGEVSQCVAVPEGARLAVGGYVDVAPGQCLGGTSVGVIFAAFFTGPSCGLQLGGDLSVESTTPTAGFKEVQGGLTVPAGAGSMRVRFNSTCVGGATPTQSYFDDLYAVVVGAAPCTATNPLGCTRWILPSSARVQGIAFFTTDLAIGNAGEAEAEVFVKFLGNNTDGRNGPESSVKIAPGAFATFPDVLKSFFGIDAGFGAIQVRSASNRLVVNSQTSTPGTAGGTFGQSVPALAAEELIRPGNPRTIVPVREDGAFRTNLIMTNATEATLDVDVAIHETGGQRQGTKRYTLPPLGMTQVNRIVRDLGLVGDIGAASLVLTTPTEGGALAAYAAVIDNTTNDPRTLLAR